MANRFPRVLQGLLHGFPTFQPDPGVTDFPTESGSIRQRRLFCHMPGSYELTYIMSRADAAEFWSFYQNNLGTRFIIPLVLPIQPTDECIDYIARFVDGSVPRQTHLTQYNWTVQVQVRIERTAQVIAPVHEAYGFSGADSEAFADYLDDFANTRLPTKWGIS